MIFTIFSALFLGCNPIFTDPSNTQSETVVVFNFDDGHKGIYDIAFKEMRRFNPRWTATHFIPTVQIGAPGRVSVAQLREMEAWGWKTGGHSITHPNFTLLNVNEAKRQIKNSHKILDSLGLSTYSFAWPFGYYNDSLIQWARQYYPYIRNSHDYLYLNGVNKHELGYFAVKSDHNSNDVIHRIEKARALRSPFVVIGFHAILETDQKPESLEYGIKREEFIRILTYLKKEQLKVSCFRDALLKL